VASYSFVETLVGGQDTTELQTALLGALSDVCRELTRVSGWLAPQLDGSAMAVRNVGLSLLRAALALYYTSDNSNSYGDDDNARATACLDQLQSLNALIDSSLAQVEASVELARHDRRTIDAVLRPLRFDAIDVRVSDVFACAAIEAAQWSPDGAVLGLHICGRVCFIILMTLL
jgi:hypothetical protein